MADLTKPSTIASGEEILYTHVSTLWDIILGTSNYDNIKVNGVKTYVAKVSQNGTDAPVATVIYNTLSGVPVWSRSGVGSYLLTLASEFVENKTVGFSQLLLNNVDDEWITHFRRSTDNLMQLDIYNMSSVGVDGWTAYIKIEVYP